MTDIERLVNQFRGAIDEARKAGAFAHDPLFCRFPHGCCGDASMLLAAFLLENDIKTNRVCGAYINDSFRNPQTHAWLLIDNHIIVDITGDQFKDNQKLLNYDKSVYVGKEDDFHELFEIKENNSHESTPLDALSNLTRIRLKELYHEIIKYI